MRYVDPETKKRLGFLTNNFALPAITIAHLYKARWHVELFFKWIKHNICGSKRSLARVRTP